MMYAEDEYVNYTKVDDSGDGGMGGACKETSVSIASKC